MATCVELWNGSASAQALRSPAAVGILTMKCDTLTGRVLLTTAMRFLLDTVSSCQMLVDLHARTRLIVRVRQIRLDRPRKVSLLLRNYFPGSCSSQLKELSKLSAPPQGPAVLAAPFQAPPWLQPLAMLQVSNLRG